MAWSLDWRKSIWAKWLGLGLDRRDTAIPAWPHRADPRPPRRKGRNRKPPSYDLRPLADYEAAVRSARYMAERMGQARQFTDLAAFLRFCVAEAPRPTDFLEFGVFSGRSVNIIADAAGHDARVVGFDSFEGLPERWREGYDAGTFAVDGLPRVRPNVELVKGWFDDTLPGFVSRLSGPVSFVHVDCDLYSSTKTIFRELAPVFGPEVILVFDEYFNYVGWEQHEFRAFQELVAETGWTYDYIACVPVHQQVAVRLRTGRSWPDLPRA